MNKERIDSWIPCAYQTLIDVGISDKNGTAIDKGYAGQIASFGAAVSTGSILSAVSFFSAQGGSSVKRNLLMLALYLVITNKTKNDLTSPKSSEKSNRELYLYVKSEKDAGREREVKEQILDAAIALKLAMNLFNLTQTKETQK
jgi:CRISPR-associated protein Cmr5